jgi:hypothetical protein
MIYASVLCVVSLAVCEDLIWAEESEAFVSATIDGQGDGWTELVESDFRLTKCDPDTWVWQGSLVHCKGTPIGVLPSVKKYRNFELVASWRHLASSGNSGIFLWCTEEALEEMTRNKLPKAGIEIQALDHGYTAKYEASSGKAADWFSTNGDVFAVGRSTMTPFAPTSPNGSRSFPKEKRSLGSPQWNHYYVRAINGEVRLWVNGREVSGGSNCNPAEGFLCLESEGSPVEFKNVRIRELP